MRFDDNVLRLWGKRSKFPPCRTKRDKDGAPAGVDGRGRPLSPPHTRRILPPNKKPSRQSERVCELVGEDLCRCAHYVARLKTFWAFEQIELDGLAFIQ